MAVHLVSIRVFLMEPDTGNKCYHLQINVSFMKQKTFPSKWFCALSVTENGATEKGHFCRSNASAIRANQSRLKITVRHSSGSHADTADIDSLCLFVIGPFWLKSYCSQDFWPDIATHRGELAPTIAWLIKTLRQILRFNLSVRKAK